MSCSGKRGVSDTFASALWMLDASLRSESLYLPLIALALLLAYERRFVWLGIALGCTVIGANNSFWRSTTA